MTESAAASPPAGRLGTFAGVFTPSILTILGIILFLRLGYVVGDAGLLRALAIIALANAVSVLTSWSLAAIATNLKVKGGGDYYLISRTLGPQFGGAIGIALFFAQSISIAFYAIGFAEGVTAVVDVGWLSERGIAALAIGPLFVLAWLGSDWATKFQFAIMAVLGLALLTFTIGAASRFEPAILDANWQPAGELPFWALFALFFPAVTGFTQGVSMSGELANPTRSLPLGTFLAVGLSTLIYFGVAVLFAGVAPGGELAADYEAMRHVSAWPAAITAGICAATLSSALASFLGAPRILQALANDRLFPLLGAFATVHPRTGNPRRAVLASVVIALATVALGDLNLVAPIVSMFFLISYGLLNYATWYEAHAGSPSFRPRFRWYHEHVSLAGCLVCAAMMFAIDPWAGGLALVVFAAVHQFLGRTVERARWNDSSRSALFQRVRRSLHAMGDTVAHDRDWRPVILAFTDEPARRARLLDFASWIEGGSGLTIAVQMVEGEGLEARRRRDELQGGLAAELEGREPPVFARVVLAGDPVVGFKTLVQAAGLGPIRPNVALFNWFDREGIAEDAPAMRAYGEYLRHALRFGCSVVVLAARGVDLARASSLPADGRRIDVWWNDDASSRLALLLSYLVTRTVEWDEAALRVLVPHSRQREVAAPEASAAAADTAQLERVRAFLDEVRIRADAVLVDGDGWERLAAASAGAALAFYPFRVRPHGPSDVRGEPLPSSLAGMPPLALVNAVHDLDLDAQPDEGPQA
ncbi:MAG: amino acid permease, partial [Planctomycetes bacterium]|nr:amino acid permease [Planctomycetota bacterium]